MQGMRPTERILLLLLVVGAPIAAYRHSYTGAFVLDDHAAIVENDAVRIRTPWAHPVAAFQAPRNTTLAGRPVAAFSVAMNYALAPEHLSRSPLPLHVGNLIIHVSAALLIFGIVSRTLETTGWPVATARRLAAATAIVWSVHPLTTAAVTYIVQRVESLMALLLALTLYAAIRAWRSRAWAAVAVAACALGMGTKEGMVVAPLIVFAWDWCFGAPQPVAAQLKSRIPLYAGLAASWALLAVVVSVDARPLSAGFGFDSWPWWRYLVTQSVVIVHYLRLAIWPNALVIAYMWPAATIAQAALPSVVLATALTFSVWALWRRHAAGFAGVGFFLLLAPSSSVLPIVTEVAADHRMYLPLAVLAAAAVSGSAAVLARRMPRARAAAVSLAGALVIAVPLAIATDTRNATYASEIGLWFDAVQKRPGDATAHNVYGALLLRSGQARAAINDLTRAIELEPDFAEAHANLGEALEIEGDLAPAITHLERALAINPFRVSAFEPLARAYDAAGQRADAGAAYLKVLDQRPDDVALLNRTAWIFATAPDAAARNGAQAVVLSEHAVALTGGADATSLDTLAAAYAEVARWDDAIRAGERALDLARRRGDRLYPAELMTRLDRYRRHQPIRSDH
jgi:tetratricopeptide (TPR) repeat protein